MAENLHVNKVVFGGDILIDLTSDDVAASDVLAGKKAVKASGAKQNKDTKFSK